VVASLDANSTPAITELDHAVFSVSAKPIEGSFVPVAPIRIVDTRAGSGRPGAGRTIGASRTLVVQVAGLDGVPRVDACAAVLNVTVRNTGAVWANPQVVLRTGSVAQAWVWPTVMPHGTLHETIRIGVAPWGRRTLTLRLRHGDPWTGHIVVLPLAAPIIFAVGSSITFGLWWWDRRRALAS